VVPTPQVAVHAHPTLAVPKEKQSVSFGHRLTIWSSTLTERRYEFLRFQAGLAGIKGTHVSKK